ncbi:MAG: SGNH/GDSL hydrolase family protein [Massilia sp.]
MTLPLIAWLTPRRRPLLAGAVLAASLAFPLAAAQAETWDEHWVGTWGAGHGRPPLPADTQVFTDQTLRLIVHTSLGGNRVRIRLSNEMGSTQLHIGEAWIAVRDSGAAISPGTGHQLRFGGATSITIPPGAPLLSDPVELNVPALSDLAISLYLPGSAAATTIHANARQTSYVSLPGNFADAATLPTARTIVSLPFLAEVDVDSNGAAIVMLGDSIGDGTRSTRDANKRWTDWLARRLQASRDRGLGAGARLGVVNRSIDGNRRLAKPPEGVSAGRNTFERFNRDVLATAGVRYLAVMSGINDIGNSPNDNPIHAAAVIAGYKQLAARAHAKGIAIFGATLTPFEGAACYSPQKEAVRQALNNWIRSTDEFDGVIDFDRVMRDPVRNSRLLPAYDSGDHLHPNDLGHQVMGNAVPLELFRPGASAK